MKLYSQKVLLTTVCTLVLNSAPLVYAAENTMAPATPGTSQAQDSKSQQNNPSGPSDQNTGSNEKKNSKTDTTKDATTPTSTMTPASPSASKTPQKDQQ